MPSLVGGQSYYLEVLYKEGTGGDYGQAAVKTAGDPTNPDTLTGIRGTFLAAPADPNGAVITITRQPASTNIQPGQTASFAVRASGVNVNGNAPIAYQWQRNIGGVWTDISGATSSNYVTAALGVPDNGAQYRTLIFIPGASSISAVATVSTGLPTLAIQIQGGNTILSWPAAFTGFTAECTPVLPAVVWTAVGPIVVANGQNTVTVLYVPGANRFYHLKQ